MSQISNRQIFYDKYTKFTIKPDIDSVTVNCLIEFIDSQDNFFWTFNRKLQAITIDDNTLIACYNIFEQLLMIYFWLQSKGYHLEGHAHYRTNNLIEFISMDTMISHYILFSGINDDQPIDKKLLYLSKNKLLSELSNNKKKLKNSWPNENDIFDTNQDNKIQILEKRLVVAENQIKKLNQKINNKKYLFWRVCGVCTIISFFTIGTYFLYVGMSE